MGCISLKASFPCLCLYPGAKLGLANIISLYVIFKLWPKGCRGGRECCAPCWVPPFWHLHDHRLFYFQFCMGGLVSHAGHGSESFFFASQTVQCSWHQRFGRCHPQSRPNRSVAMFGGRVSYIAPLSALYAVFGPSHRRVRWAHCEPA